MDESDNVLESSQLWDEHETGDRREIEIISSTAVLGRLLFMCFRQEIRSISTHTPITENKHQIIKISLR